MLNLVQHLMKSIDYETLKRVPVKCWELLGQPHTSHFKFKSKT